MARIHLIVLLLGALVALTSAASAPTFCKCTCFKNSTIIPLGPAHDSDSDSSSSTLVLRRDFTLNPHLKPNLPTDHGKPREFILSKDDSANKARRDQHHNSPRSASTSCSACTKAFCLSQGISFCKDAEEEDVVTMCFQRDSNKDKIIVWGFILGVVGLLGWAAFKRFVEWRDARALGRGAVNYAPVR